MLQKALMSNTQPLCKLPQVQYIDSSKTDESVCFSGYKKGKSG